MSDEKPTKNVETISNETNPENEEIDFNDPNLPMSLRASNTTADKVDNANKQEGDPKVSAKKVVHPNIINDLYLSSSSLEAKIEEMRTVFNSYAQHFEQEANQAYNLIFENMKKNVNHIKEDLQLRFN